MNTHTHTFYFFSNHCSVLSLLATLSLSKFAQSLPVFVLIGKESIFYLKTNKTKFNFISQRRQSDGFLIPCNQFIMSSRAVRASRPQQIQVLNQIRVTYCFKSLWLKSISPPANSTQMFKAHGQFLSNVYAKHYFNKGPCRWDRQTRIEEFITFILRCGPGTDLPMRVDARVWFLVTVWMFTFDHWMESRSRWKWKVNP